MHARDACGAANVHFTTAYHRRNRDADFRQAWDDAVKFGTVELENEAARRSYHGTLKPVYYKGKIVGDIREYSDTLLMFLLRGRKPEVYRDNKKVEHSGPEGGVVPIGFIEFADQPAVPDDEPATIDAVLCDTTHGQ